MTWMIEGKERDNKQRKLLIKQSDPLAMIWLLLLSSDIFDFCSDLCITISAKK